MTTLSRHHVCLALLAVVLGACSATRFVQERDSFSTSDEVTLTTSTFRVKQDVYRLARNQPCFVVPVRFVLSPGSGALDPSSEVELHVRRDHKRRLEDDPIAITYGTAHQGESFVAACKRIRVAARGEVESVAPNRASVTLRKQRERDKRNCITLKEEIERSQIADRAAREHERQLQEAQAKYDRLKALSEEAPDAGTVLDAQQAALKSTSEAALSALELQIAGLSAQRGMGPEVLQAQQTAYDNLSCDELLRDDAPELMPDYVEPAAIEVFQSDGQYEMDLVLTMDEHGGRERRLLAGDVVELSFTPVLAPTKESNHQSRKLETSKIAFRVTRENDAVGVPVGLGLIGAFLVLLGL